MSWQRSNAGAALALLILCAVLVLILDHGRGIWLDEATSFFLSGHDIGFSQAFRERWISDVHPPLYSLYAWALQPLLGGSVQEMRLINLGGLLYAAMVWRQAWRRGIDRDFLLLFAVLVASSPFFILYAAEFRSYFLQLVLGACLVVQLRMVDEGRGGLPLFALTGLLLVNLHYYGSLVGLILTGAGVVHFTIRRRWRDAALLLAILIAAVIPLGLAALAMLAEITPVKVSEISQLRGLIAIGTIAGAATVPNLVALVLLSKAPLPEEGRKRFAIVLAAALAAVMAAYFGLNLVTHNLLSRHMIGAAPIGAALFALLLEQYVKTNRRAFGLICANAALIALAAAAYGLVNQRWETNVGRIESAMAACPGSRLHALNAMSLLDRGDRFHSVPHIDRYFALTYQLIARSRGWNVRVLPGDGPISAGRGCPSLLWIEHHYARPGLTDVELARIAGFEGPIRVTRLQRGDARALLAVSRAP